MNFIDGELEATGDRARFRAPGLSLALRGGIAAPAARVILGVRPEHVRLSDDDDGSAATVSLIEPLGDETLVFLDYGGPASVVAKVDADEKVAVGEARRFTVRSDRVVFFDAVTGERVRR